MRRPSLGLILSTIVNILLSVWLVENYFYDVYFQSYVNNALSQVNLFLVAGILAVGTAGVGYFHLRRRGPSYSVGLRQKEKGLRQGAISPSRTSPQVEGRGFQTASRSDSETKHTQYAVPTLTKAPPSSGTGPGSQGSRGFVTGAITAALKPQGPPPQRDFKPSLNPPGTRVQPSPVEQSRFQNLGAVSSRPPASSAFPTPNKVQPSPSLGSRTGSTPPWVVARPQFPPAPQKGSSEKAAPFAITGIESSNKPRPMSGDQEKLQSPQASGLFVSKWKRPDDVGKQAQWVDPVPKQSFPVPQKWSPPAATGLNTRPLPTSAQQRTGQGSPSQPLGLQRPPPRPLAFPGALGVRESRPVESRAVRPGEGTPTSPVGRTPVPASGLGLAPTSPARGPTESGKPSGIAQSGTPVTSRAADASSEPILESKREPYAASAVGEMDWDTALDTILKTLRKDKIAEKE